MGSPEELDQAPASLEEQEVAREGQTPKSLHRIPIPAGFGAVHAVPTRRQRGCEWLSWVGRAMPVRGLRPAPVTCFLLREPSPSPLR